MRYTPCIKGSFMKKPTNAPVTNTRHSPITHTSRSPCATILRVYNIKMSPNPVSPDALTDQSIRRFYDLQIRLFDHFVMVALGILAFCSILYNRILDWFTTHSFLLYFLILYIWTMMNGCICWFLHKKIIANLTFAWSLGSISNRSTALLL